MPLFLSHAANNNKYQYWNGLLLIVRVILYITASITVSDNPQTSFLVTIILVGTLFPLSKHTGVTVYKHMFRFCGNDTSL